MRIILHTPEPIHGAARYVCELAKALARGRESVVLHCPANFEYKEEAKAAGVELKYAPARDVSLQGLWARLSRNLCFALYSAWDLFRITRKGDVVHFEFPIHLPLGFLGLILVRLRGARVVLTAHDPVPHRWRFGATLHRFERAMLAAFYRGCDEIVVHNDSGKEILRCEFDLPESRITVIPHGPMSQAETVHEPARDCLRLLVFGSIRENKGIHLAIQAVQAVNQGTKTPRARLTIVGLLEDSRESGYWRRCRELIASAPEAFEVSEHFIADQELPSLFGRHHAVLLPYVDFHSESGVAALALSQGCPILATRAGGLGQLLQQSECGVAIEAVTVNGVAEAIEKALAAGFDQLSRIGTTGRDFMIRVRGWELIAAETQLMYRTLTDSAHAGVLAATIKAQNQ